MGKTAIEKNVEKEVEEEMEDLGLTSQNVGEDIRKKPGYLMRSVLSL
jgi:hypothetical protein